MVVYDRTGRRSATAQSLLTQQGFENVRNLTGGVFAWIEAFGSVSPQLQPAAPPPPPPPPQPELTSADFGTEDTTTNDPVSERPNDESTFELDQGAEDSGGDDTLDEDGLSGDENVPAAVDAEEGEEAVAPEGDPGDEDWAGDDTLDEHGLSGDENVPAAVDAEEGEEAVAPEGDPGDEDWAGDEDGSARSTTSAFDQRDTTSGKICTTTCKWLLITA
jgi:hypothetical protein